MMHVDEAHHQQEQYDHMMDSLQEHPPQPVTNPSPVPPPTYSTNNGHGEPHGVPAVSGNGEKIYI